MATTLQMIGSHAERQTCGLGVAKSGLQCMLPRMYAALHPVSGGFPAAPTNMHSTRLKAEWLLFVLPVLLQALPAVNTMATSTSELEPEPEEVPATRIWRRHWEKEVMHSLSGIFMELHRLSTFLQNHIKPRHGGPRAMKAMKAKKTMKAMKAMKTMKAMRAVKVASLEAKRQPVAAKAMKK